MITCSLCMPIIHDLYFYVRHKADIRRIASLYSFYTHGSCSSDLVISGIQGFQMN